MSGDNPRVDEKWMSNIHPSTLLLNCAAVIVVSICAIMNEDSFQLLASLDGWGCNEKYKTLKLYIIKLKINKSINNVNLNYKKNANNS